MSVTYSEILNDYVPIKSIGKIQLGFVFIDSVLIQVNSKVSDVGGCDWFRQVQDSIITNPQPNKYSYLLQNMCFVCSVPTLQCNVYTVGAGT